MSYCQIKDDPSAQRYCQHEESKLRLPLFLVDTGTEEVVVNKVKGDYRADSVLKGVGDSHVSAQEAYKTIVAIVGSRNRLAGLFGSPDLDFLKDKGVPDGRLDIPWIPADAARREIINRVSAIHGELDQLSSPEGEKNYDLEFGRRLFKEIGDQVLGDFARCLRFTTRFLMYADLAGIRAYPALLLRDSSGKQMLHVAVAFLDDDKSIVAIANSGRLAHLGKPEPGEIWVVISRLELLAYHYQAKGVAEKDPKKKTEYFDFALRLSPGNYLSLFSRANMASERGESQKAIDLYLASIAAYPLFPHAYWNLRLEANKSNRYDLARWAHRKYLEFNQD